jgi:hypothetical protein
MNQELFCSICVDSAATAAATAAIVAAITGGVVKGRGVDCSWAYIVVDDDYGDHDIRFEDPDDFLGWPTLLEVMPPDDAKRPDVLGGVTSLMNGLLRRGLRVLAKGDYAEELPGGGEVASPGDSSSDQPGAQS